MALFTQEERACATEAANRMDPATEKLVQRLIGQLTAGRGTSHDTVVAAETCTLLDIELNGIRCLVQSVARTAGPRAKRRQLCRREHQVACLIADGLAAKQIARQLGICTDTVRTYKCRIFDKLNVNTQAEMVARLMREGLID